jgi:hypothetical protein
MNRPISTMPCLVSGRRSNWSVAVVALIALGTASTGSAVAQGSRANDVYRPPNDGGYAAPSAGAQPYDQRSYEQPQSQSANNYGGGGYSAGGNGGGRGNDSYRPPADQQPVYQQPTYQDPPYQQGPPPREQSGGYGQPYSAAPPQAYVDERAPPSRVADGHPTRGYYSEGEITEKGRGFFGSITQGLASAIEYTYRQAGRPNGYILGEDGGGAFFAGLRYGEGMLYTKDAGDHKVFWQGPSLGYDVGGEGSKTMVLVYNMTNSSDIYRRFGGVEGSAYVVGGVSVQFQKNDDVTLAIIRSGVGLRLGANVGYLKYTRNPTWNPF